MLTPNNFNPHCDSYAYNEAGMLDWEGNMVASHHRDQVIFTHELANDATLSSSLALPSEQNRIIDDLLDIPPEVTPECHHTIPCACDTCSSVGSEPWRLYERLSTRADLAQFQMSIGSTIAATSSFLIDLPEKPDSDSEYEQAPSHLDDDDMFTDVWESHQHGNINLDEIMAIGAAHELRSRGIDASHLSKVWRIDFETAKRTLDITTQHSQRTDNPALTTHVLTNDQMLCYRRVKEYLFMDTFFTTSKSGKSSQGNTC